MCADDNPARRNSISFAVWKENVLGTIGVNCTYNFTQGFTQEKIGSQNGPFTKIGYLKIDPLQKSDLKMDPKIKNYNVFFYSRSAANEFTMK